MKMTASQRKLSVWEEIRELDRLALPKVESLGVELAYREALKQSDRSSCTVPRD